MVGSTVIEDEMPNTAEVNEMSHSVLGAPEWVAKKLGLPANRVAILETIYNPNFDRRYYILLEYLAHRAVDIDETEIPNNAVSNADGIPNRPRSRLLRQTEREYPGLLSVLAQAPAQSACNFAPVKMRTASGIVQVELDSDNEDEPDFPPYHFGFGRARLKHQGSDIYVLHSYTGRPTGKQSSSMQYKAVYLYGATPQLLRSQINEVTKWAFERAKPDRKPRTGKYQLYTLEIYMTKARWKCQGWKKSRTLESIFLKEGMMDAIIEDFRRFTSKGTKAFYTRHGVPHRRSYVFHGPPGTGKTSTIRALAGNLNLSACFLELGDDHMSNSHLQQALRTLPLPAMLVIEDIDVVFKPNRDAKNPRSPLTFSGLLNALDGLVSTDGVLTVMTTNHLNRLDPALIRPGRIDRRFEFTKPTNKQFSDMFRSFYPDEKDAHYAQQFADIVVGRAEKEARSIATLMELFIYTRDLSAKETVDSVDSFFKEFYPGSGPDVYASIYS